MSARALNDNLHITGQFASPRPILGHDADDSKLTGERRGERPGIYSCLLIGISKRAINHLNLPLIRRIVGVPLGRGDIALAHPLLKGPHRHTGRDLREEFAFQVQLADYGHLLRRERGSTIDDRQPGAPPIDWS